MNRINRIYGDLSGADKGYKTRTIRDGAMD
jgi:hypothetical protein